jgi:predicted transglutaminase-like cysteine proteinase
VTTAKLGANQRRQGQAMDARTTTRLTAAALLVVGIYLGVILAARTHASADLIETVNQRVNRQLTYRANPNDYDWIAYSRFGDCKTYVALKRQVLIRDGVDPGRLSIWQGADETGRLHAILVVDGRRALDNRFAWTANLKDLQDIGGRGRGYRMQPCRWCEQMARWLSPLPQDRDATLPDFGYGGRLQALREPAIEGRSGPPLQLSR